ncbi:MAG: hypothetical protein HYT64_02715 [Candidatus Yanofskybacteria bacterium]|nr:hypothetical protein [Candidatus Yanofskybacteria bacterium]
MNTDNNLTQEQVDYEVSQFERSPNINLGMNFEYYSPFRVDAKNASEISWESFLQKVNTISVSIKNVLTDANTVEFIITLAEDFELTDNQSANISRIIRDTLVGDLFINDLTVTISQKLILDQDTAKQIRDKIVNNLLAPIIEEVKKLQTERSPEKVSRPAVIPELQTPRIPDRPDLKIEPEINRNNVIDLRNK